MTQITDDPKDPIEEQEAIEPVEEGSVSIATADGPGGSDPNHPHGTPPL